MEPITITLLVALTMIVGVVWLILHIAFRLIRMLLWGVALPFRLVSRSKPTRGKGQSPLTLHRLVLRCANGKCGASLDDVARFCPRCGTRVAESRVEQLPIQVSGVRIARVA